jgi:hypothetical protein
MMSIPTRHIDNCIDFTEAKFSKIYDSIKKHSYDVAEYCRLESYFHYRFLEETEGGFEPDFDPRTVNYPIIVECTFNESSTYDVFLLAEDYYEHCKRMCELFENR